MREYVCTELGACQSRLAVVAVVSIVQYVLCMYLKQALARFEAVSYCRRSTTPHDRIRAERHPKEKTVRRKSKPLSFVSRKWLTSAAAQRAQQSRSTWAAPCTIPTIVATCRTPWPLMPLLCCLLAGAISRVQAPEGVVQPALKEQSVFHVFRPRRVKAPGVQGVVHVTDGLGITTVAFTTVFMKSGHRHANPRSVSRPVRPRCSISCSIYVGSAPSKCSIRLVVVDRQAANY